MWRPCSWPRTHSYLLIFTDKGRLYWLKVHEIPQAGRASKGKAIVNLVQLMPDENVSTVLAVARIHRKPPGDHGHPERHGEKDRPDGPYSRPRAGGIIAINLAEGDSLVATRITDGDMEVFLATRQGQAIRFHESQVRSMGRNAGGVKGIDLADGDLLVAMEAVAGAQTLLTITENGFGQTHPHR